MKRGVEFTVGWTEKKFEAWLLSMPADKHVGRVSSRDDCPLCRFANPLISHWSQWLGEDYYLYFNSFASVDIVGKYESTFARNVDVPAWAIVWQDRAKGKGNITAGEALAILRGMNGQQAKQN